MPQCTRCGADNPFHVQTCRSCGEAIVSYLTVAMERNDVEAVKAFIKKGANVNVANEKGDTPLHWAITTGRSDLIELLIEKGANLNARNMKGLTPLHGAVYMNQKDNAHVLIMFGADVHAKDSNKSATPLHLAAGVGNREIAELLIEKGADLNARDYRGLTPLTYAKARGHKDMEGFLAWRGGKD